MPQVKYIIRWPAAKNKQVPWIYYAFRGEHVGHSGSHFVVHRTAFLTDACIFATVDDAREEMEEIEWHENNYEIVELTDKMIEAGKRELFEAKLNGSYMSSKSLQKSVGLHSKEE